MSNELKLRELLWLRHGCEGATLYGDDGNMQCPKCGIDFLYDSVASIESHLTQRAADVCHNSRNGQHKWEKALQSYEKCSLCGIRR